MSKPGKPPSQKPGEGRLPVVKAPKYEPPFVECAVCEGYGVLWIVPLEQWVTCRACAGQGEITVQ